MPVGQRWQVVQAQVFLQKGARQRVAVAGGHVGAAPVAHQRGQCQAAADFQNALAGRHWVARHARRQVRARRPQQPKQRPAGGRYAALLGLAQRVEKLLAVQQRTDGEVVHPVDRNAFVLEQVTGHQAARGGQGRVKACKGDEVGSMGKGRARRCRQKPSVPGWPLQCRRRTGLAPAGDHADLAGGGAGPQAEQGRAGRRGRAALAAGGLVFQGAWRHTAQAGAGSSPHQACCAFPGPLARAPGTLPAKPHSNAL